MGVERLRKAVLTRAKKEAEEIIRKAREEAERIVSEAKKEYERRLARERERIIRSVVEENMRKYVSKVMELNREIVKLKNNVLSRFISTLKDRLSKLSDEERERSLSNLISEALETGIFGSNRLVIKVVNRDLELARKIVKRSRELRNRVVRIDVLSDDYVGGVLIESEDGSVAVDNTYLARIERIMPEIIKRLNKEVFEVSK